MPYPIRVCAICSEEFELKPGKPGFANHCPNCTEEQEAANSESETPDAGERGSDHELNAERRRAMRDLLYRKDS